MARKFFLKYSLLLAFAAAFVLVFVTADSALAHERIEVGPYVMVIGWENEPAIVGDRNFLTIEVSKDGEPVEDVEATVNLQVLYGGHTFTTNLNPTSTPGLYHVDMYPTVRGQYTLQFTGSIGDTAVDDVQVNPEEVLPASALEFPQALPDTTALQAKVDDLAAQLQSARLMAIGGIVVGVIGIGLGAAGMLRKRS